MTATTTDRATPPTPAAGRRHPGAGAHRPQRAARHQDRLAARADPVLRRPAADHHRARPAVPVPVRARQRPVAAHRAPARGGLNLRTFLYPGILAMAVHVHRACSPPRRSCGTASSVSCARCSSRPCGAARSSSASASAARPSPASRASSSSRIAGLVGVPYDAELIIAVFGIQLLLAFTITTFGVMMAARIKQMQSFMALTQMLVLPLYFLSGAMFPASNLPPWLTVAQPDRSADLRRRSDAARRLLPPDLSPAVRRTARPRRHVGRLAGADPARGRASSPSWPWSMLTIAIHRFSKTD